MQQTFPEHPRYPWKSIRCRRHRYEGKARMSSITGESILKSNQTITIHFGKYWFEGKPLWDNVGREFNGELGLGEGVHAWAGHSRGPTRHGCKGRRGRRFGQKQEKEWPVLRLRRATRHSTLSSEIEGDVAGLRDGCVWEDDRGTGGPSGCSTLQALRKTPRPMGKLWCARRRGIPERGVL